MNKAKTYETVQEAAVAKLLKKDTWLWRVVRTPKGKYALRCAKLR